MKKYVAVAIIFTVFSVLLATPSSVMAQGSNQTPRPNQGMREFMLSATYGALAGGLVGAASLAFSEKPGDSLNKVARGASIGLYAGILLGLYVLYGGPAQDDDDVSQHLETPKFLIAPVIGERGFEGAQAHYSVVEF